MKTMRTLLGQFTLLAISLACLVLQANAASPGNDGNTFQLQSHSTMGGAGTMFGPRGSASSFYGQHGSSSNQDLQISCRGLAAGQVYHLMASVGTNGKVVHLSDFMPNKSGVILMHYTAGIAHHFSGTNDPSQAWGPTGDWTNHMSWVIYPDGGTNWCNTMHPQVGGPPQMDDGMGTQYGSKGGMGGSGGGMGGSGGGMGGGWPVMTNWLLGMSDWWPTMANWCWSYTNMWTAGSQYGGSSSNWWGSLGRGGSHMMPLPESLDLVPAINGLVVMDVNLQPVLTADLATPDSFAFRARSGFHNQGIVPGATATMQVSATKRSTHFALSAMGLAPSTTYFMAINDSNITPVATDAHGQLRMRQLPGVTTSMRGIGSISILDRNYRTILNATLPPG